MKRRRVSRRRTDYRQAARLDRQDQFIGLTVCHVAVDQMCSLLPNDKQTVFDAISDGF